MLAVDLGEPDAVRFVGDDEIEHGPDQGEAAVLAAEPADHFGAAFDLAEGSLEEVGAALSAAVADGVAQVHDERVEVVGQAIGCGAVAGLVELANERLELLLGVVSVHGLIERLPLRSPHAFALGHLGVEVARAVHAAALPVRHRPAMFDRFDQPGGAVGHDQHRCGQAAGDQIAPELLPILEGLAHPEAHGEQHPLALLGEAPRDLHAFLGPVLPDREKGGV